MPGNLGFEVGRVVFPPELGVLGFEVVAAAAVDAAVDAAVGGSGSAVFTGGAASGGGAGLTVGAAAVAVEVGAAAGCSEPTADPRASESLELPPPTRRAIIVMATAAKEIPAARIMGSLGFFRRSGKPYPADVCENPAPVAGVIGDEGGGIAP
jgi:hypothetical protein